MSTKRKNNLAKKIMLGLMTTCVMSSWITVAYALPMGGVVANGNATISTPGDNTMNIKQTTDRAVINWGSFNIGAGETVNFLQPSVASSTLNRVGGNSLSTIAGKMNANGSIILINPNGLIFSQGSVVNAAGIVASTANITDENYMAGKMIFDQTSTTNANIEVYGTLNAETNGEYVNSLNVGGIKPATTLSVLNNKIMLVADGNVILGDTGSDAQLTAVTTTTLTSSKTVGQEGFDVADPSSTAVGKITIRSDQNANDTGTVTLNNTNRDNIKSHSVDIYYNPELAVGNYSDGKAIKDYKKHVDYSEKIAQNFTAKVNNDAGTNVEVADKKSVGVGSYMLVNSKDQLQSIDNAIHGNMSGKYAQGKSLDVGTFKTLGSDTDKFSGTFSGHGGTATYSINNLTIDNSSSSGNTGLFANVTGTISDVLLEAANITGKDNVGGIAGKLSGTITGTTVKGTITGKTNVGGLVGTSTGNVSWSSNEATVTGDANTGGIIGNMTSGTVSTSSNLGTITGTTDTGGIAGKMNGTSEIKTTYNSGQITGMTNTGGIVGEMVSGKLNKVYNTNEASKLGKVITDPNETKSTYGKITGVTNTGGLVGKMDDGTIDTAYNAGNVTATGENTGGLIGTMSGGKVEHAYNADNNTVLDTTGGKLDKYYGFTYKKPDGTVVVCDYEVTIVGDKVVNVNTHPEWDTPGHADYIPFKDRVYNIRLAYRDANVTGTSNVGGIVGNMTGGTINQVYNAGKVTGTTTTGGIAGIATGSTVTDSFFVTTDKGNSNNISGQTNAFGTGSIVTPTDVTAKTLFAAQTAGEKTIGVTWSDGTTTISDNNNQNSDWIVYNGQTTPLLKGFMDWIDINRVYEYNGETRNLVTNDINNYYGGAFFNKNDGSGKNVNTSGYVDADKTKYPGSSEYHYDQSSMWSPQHGYQTTASSSLIITPKALEVNVSGGHTYGELPLKDYYLSQGGKNYWISLGTDGNYVTEEITDSNLIKGKYKLTFDGFVKEENYNDALTGLLKNGTLSSGSAFKHEKDQQQLGAGTHDFGSGNDKLGGFTAKNNNYNITYKGTLEVKKADLNFTADGNREYGNNNTGSVTGDGFNFKAADVAKDINESANNDGKLKSWDNTKGEAGDITKLSGFKKTDDTAAFELYYKDANGNKVKIDNVTDVKIDENNIVVGYTLADGSFQKGGNGEYQLTTSNYNLIFKGGNSSSGGTIPDNTYTINKAKLVYTADNKDRIYGDENPLFTGSFAGLKNGQTAEGLGLNTSLTSEAQKGTDVGEYNITANGKNDLKNYNVTYNNGTLTINKADLVYNVNNATKNYGDKNPNFSGSVDPDSLKNGDTLESLFGETFYHKTEAGDWSNIGEYDITASGDLTNYNVTYNKGTLTVVPTQFYYKATPSEYLYTQAIGSQTGRIVDKNGRDVTEFIKGNANFTTSAIAGTPVGQYAIFGSNIAVNENFTMAQMSANYTALTIKNAGIIVRTDPIYEAAANANVENQFSTKDSNKENGSSGYQYGGYKREEDRGSLRYLTILDGGINREQLINTSGTSNASQTINTPETITTFETSNTSKTINTPETITTFKTINTPETINENKTEEV